VLAELVLLQSELSNKQELVSSSGAIVEGGAKVRDNRQAGLGNLEGVTWVGIVKKFGRPTLNSRCIRPCRQDRLILYHSFVDIAVL